MKSSNRRGSIWLRRVAAVAAGACQRINTHPHPHPPPPSIIIQFKLNLPGAKTLLIFSVSGFEKKQRSFGERGKKKKVLTLAR